MSRKTKNAGAEGKKTRRAAKPVEETSSAADSACVEASAVVSSETSQPEAAPVAAQPESQPETKQQEPATMETESVTNSPTPLSLESFILARTATSKNGKKVVYTNPALPRGVTLPLSAFLNGVAPESLTLKGDGFKTRSADEQAKAEARNAKRAAKGLKPKPTPEERKKMLDARQAKLEAKLTRARAASEKLAKKLGTVATATAPAATEEAPAAQ